jgi:hypothetical protein
MAERRPLSEGLKPPIDPQVEKNFVFPKQAQPKAEPKPAVAAMAKSPISTRIRADYAAALKRASLERQLSGQEPNTLQDILEDAIGPWLKSHDYIS